MHNRNALHARAPFLFAVVLAACTLPTDDTSHAAALPRQLDTALSASMSTAAANDPTVLWTFCTKAGNVCNFLGLRDVRLADPTNTKAVTQTAYHSVPCAVYGFNNQNPAPGKALHCDYGPVKTATL